MKLAVMESFASIYTPAFYPFLSFCSTSWDVSFVFHIYKYMYISFIFLPFCRAFHFYCQVFFLNHLSVPLKNHPTLVLLIFLKDLICPKKISELKIFLFLVLSPSKVFTPTFSVCFGFIVHVRKGIL